MTPEAWLGLATVLVLGAMSPGPSVAVVIRNTMAGGRLLRGRSRSLAMAAMEGQSVGFGLLPSNPVGSGVRPVSITWCPSECSM